MLLSLLTAISIAPPLMPSAYAGEKTIIVDENNPPRRRQIKPSWNTRVINIINTGAAHSGPGPEGDICPLPGGYYCRSAGKEAWLKLEPMVPDKGASSGEKAWLGMSEVFIGRITGVAWRGKGEAIGRYLGPLDADLPLERAIRKNHLSARDSFYFIIDMEGLEGPALVEAHRIRTGE